MTTFVQESEVDDLAPFSLDLEHARHQPTSDDAQDNRRQSEQLLSVLPNLRKPKARNSTQPKRTSNGPKQRAWKDDETTALLKSVNLPQFQPQRRTRSRVAWELIVEAIHGQLGSPDAAITVKRCKERMKTLTGDRYYKRVRSNWEKKNLGGNLTEDDWRKELHECGLTVDWYKAIEEYIQGRPSQGRGMSVMQMECDLDRNETTNCPSSSHIGTLNDPSEPVPAIVPTQKPAKSAQNRFAAQVFNDMGTNLILLESFVNRKLECDRFHCDLRCLVLLAVVQARRFNSMNDLQRSTLLDLVMCDGLECLEFLGSVNIDLVSRCCRWLSIVQNRRESAVYEDVIALEKMRLVSFQADSEDEMGEGSDEDEVVAWKPRIDFSRSKVCEEFLKKVITRTPVYDTRRIVYREPIVKFDSSSAPVGISLLNLMDCGELKEADLSCFRMLRSLFILECPKLRKIIGWEHLEELGWLEIAGCPSYDGYPPLQRIPSLQEFHFWPEKEPSSALPGGELDLSGCVRLRVLDIYCDAALSSIHGFEGLRTLAILNLSECTALENLPDIGHMKDLTFLDICSTAVDEIKGVEKLSNLKKLDCASSKLKTLPDLSHLPRLQFIGLSSCPVTDDPSSPYYKKSFVQFNKNKYVDVSDVSDDESDIPC